MDRAVWQATVHGVAKSRTQLKQPSIHRLKQNPQEDAGVRSGHCAPWN